MPQALFSSGALYAIPSGSNPTPVQLAELGESSVELDYAVVELRGGKSFPIAIAKGEAKLTGTAKLKSWNNANLELVAPGITKTTARAAGIRDEIATIPTTPFQVTVASGGANFKSDLGVVDRTTGLTMTCGATATGTGVYAVSATGVYTFNTADAGHVVAISYDYNVPAAGKTRALANSLMALSTGYQLRVWNNTGGKDVGLTIYSAHFNKWGLSAKVGAFAESDLPWTASEDPLTGKVMDAFGVD